MKIKLLSNACHGILTGILCFISIGLFAQQNVGIGTTTPDNSAMLEVYSTSKGLLIPRLTTVQRLAIIAPATGLLVYDTDFGQFWYFDGVVWVQAIGPQGPAGPQGIQGATGMQGVQGPIGPSGADGIQGPTGPQGQAGINGNDGPTGPAGPQGIQGPTGPQGNAGVAGPQGATGQQGNAGVAGPQGTTGPQGNAGVAGPQGTTGPQGNAGANGAQGPTGPAGPVGCGSANYLIKTNGSSAICTLAPIYEDASGKVSIGTTSPATKLHIYESGTIADLRLMSSLLDNANAGGRVSFWSNGIGGFEDGYYSCINTGFGEFTTTLSQNYYGTAMKIYSIGPFASRSQNITLGNSVLYIYDYDAGTSYGRVGIGTTSPGYKLTVNGQPAANGFTAFTNYSDARLKRNVADIGSCLDKIMLLRPVQFNYNEEYLNLYDDPGAITRVQKGFIAQEVKEIFPEMVGSVKVKGKEYYDLNLSNLQVYMVKAMQELYVQNQEQRKEINELKARLEKVEKGGDR